MDKVQQEINEKIIAIQSETHLGNSDGNFTLALVMGIIATLLVSFTWNLFNYWLGAELDEMGEFLCVFIGLAVRMGKGTSIRYSLLAGGLAIISSILQMFLDQIDFFRHIQYGNLGLALSRMDFWEEFQLMLASAEFFDLFMLSAGVFIAYKVARVYYEWV